MPLPSIGGGYQFGDGNGNEANLYAQANPQTAIAVTTSARFLARKTGDLAWTLYRTA